MKKEIIAPVACDDRGERERDFGRQPHYTRLDFPAINAAALQSLPILLQRWLPDGK